MITVILDALSIGKDLDLSLFEEFGPVTVYDATEPKEICSHLQNADIVVMNKIRLRAETLAKLPRLKLICESATGYDNIDVSYCKAHGIAVCNVKGYSTDCVAQLTVTMALSLMTRLQNYESYVRSGAYSVSGVPNRLSPVFHEIAGKTWGILGYGNIGKQVGKVAEALGCRILVTKRTPEEGVECVDLERLCRESDILSIHLPLNDTTRNLLDREHIAMLKPNAIVINVARGAITDEAALADAILENRIGGLGVDVYSIEPFPVTHPFYQIRENERVIFTPHMAWGGFETRTRLLWEMAENIRAYLHGEIRNRVDLLDQP